MMTKLTELRFAEDMIGPLHRLADDSLEQLPDELDHPLYSRVGRDREQETMLGRIPENMRFITREVNVELVPDVSLTNSGFVVSNRFKSLLEQHGALELEFVRTMVELPGRRYSNGKYESRTSPTGDEVLHDYWFMNSWHRLDIIDPDLSDADWGYVEFGPKRTVTLRGQEVPDRWINDWRRLALKEDPGDDPFFGLQWFLKRRFISELLAHDVASAGLNVGIWTLDLDTGLTDHQYGTIR